MAIHAFKTTTELIEAIAKYFVQVANESIGLNGAFNVVLSGGKSPEALYRKLALPEYHQQLDWSKVNFFFGDERYVPSNDPQNNAHLARQILLDPLNISASRIFAVNTTLLPAHAAKDYVQQITDHFKGRDLVFDFILLGLGDNAHTASLFPHTDVLSESSASVKAVFLQEQNVYRITMTAPLINQARHIAFLVFGRSKAEAVQHVLEGAFDPEQYPAQLIKPEHDHLEWYVDEEAVRLLKRL